MTVTHCDCSPQWQVARYSPGNAEMAGTAYLAPRKRLLQLKIIALLREHQPKRISHGEHGRQDEDFLNLR